MYVMGVVLAVQGDKEEEYHALAKSMADIFMDYGALEVMENWEDDVQDGEHTDMRRAVAAKDGEKIVFGWVVWPDKATYDKAHVDMMEDERMKPPFPEMPFDGKRMIFGGFRNIYSAKK